MLCSALCCAVNTRELLLLYADCASRVLYAAGAGEGFTITPVAAGHLIGGCAWRITTPENEDIVYAVHYNHRKQVRRDDCMLPQMCPTGC